MRADIADALNKLPKVAYYRLSEAFLVNAGGWFVTLLFKRPDEGLSFWQQGVMEEVTLSDGLVYVVDSAKSLKRAMKSIAACCLLANEIRRPT